MHAKSLQSCLPLCSPTDFDHQAPLSMGFPRQEYWSGVPFLSPGDLPDPETELTSLTGPELAVGFFTTRVTYGKPHTRLYLYYDKLWYWACVLICVQLFVTPWTITHQSPLSAHGISQSRIWSCLPFPSPWDLPYLENPDSCIGRQILYHWATLGKWHRIGPGVLLANHLAADPPTNLAPPTILSFSRYPSAIFASGDCRPFQESWRPLLWTLIPGMMAPKKRWKSLFLCC